MCVFKLGCGKNRLLEAAGHHRLLILCFSLSLSLAVFRIDLGFRELFCGSWMARLGHQVPNLLKACELTSPVEFPWDGKLRRAHHISPHRTETTESYGIQAFQLQLVTLVQ